MVEVLKFEGAELANDGRHMKLELETDGDRALILDVNVSLLENIVQQLSPLFEQARKLRGGAVIVPPMEPDGSIAKPMPNRQGVLVAFRMPNGLDHTFVFSVPDAERLGQRIASAVETCKSSS